MSRDYCSKFQQLSIELKFRQCFQILVSILAYFFYGSSFYHFNQMFHFHNQVSCIQIWMATLFFKENFFKTSNAHSEIGDSNFST